MYFMEAALGQFGQVQFNLICCSDFVAYLVLSGWSPCHLDRDAALRHGSRRRHGHSLPHRRHLLQRHHGLLSSLSLQFHEV